MKCEHVTLALGVPVGAMTAARFPSLECCRAGEERDYVQDNGA